MTHKLAIGTIGFVLFLASFAFVSAQDTSTSVAGYCPNLSITMQRCDLNRPLSQQRCTDATTNGEVSMLQRFLIDQEYLIVDAPTGYFGAKTQSAVRTFQCEKMGICTGDESTTGWGVVGPKTRAAIARVCGTNTLPTNQSCITPWGTIVAHNANVTAYQSSSVATGQQCLFETRHCQSGTLTGSYQYQTCQVQTTTTTSCTPLQPQTQTLTCPTGQIGAITQTRTSTCPGPTWGAWTTTANTCTTPLPPPPPPPSPNVGACTYKGQSYAEGQSVTIYITGGAYSTSTCDNGVWAFTIANHEYDLINIGRNVCELMDDFYYGDAAYSDFTCLSPRSSKAFLSVQLRHGMAPLAVRVGVFPALQPPYTYTLHWGDETNATITAGSTMLNHTYASAGTYTISFTSTSGLSNSATIRVDAAGVTSVQNQSQLANALTALESALKAFLKLLGQ